MTCVMIVGRKRIFEDGQDLQEYVWKARTLS